MIAAWGFFIPLGTLLAVYRRYVGKNGKVLKKEPSFYPWHRNLQWFGFILAMIGFGMGAAGSRRVYETGRPFNDTLLNYWNEDIPWNRHVKLGVSVLIIAGAQVFMGIAAHILKARHGKKPDAGPWKRPLIPSWLHVVMGFSCVCLAYVTIYQGLQIFDSIFYSLEKTPGIKAGYAIVSISGFFFLTFYIYEKTSLILCGAGDAPAAGAADKEDAAEEKPEAPVVKDEENVGVSTEALGPDEGAS
jgi:hypothetical protein